jgi:hypothetical protein
MADTKISALPASTTPLAGTEVLPIVQSGVTRQVSVANLTAGRAISATQLTLSTGNLIVANGQGIDFSATPGTGTSELFDDYEEGTWTPTVAGDATGVINTASGQYTKIGNVVYFRCVFGVQANFTASSIGGLPFTCVVDNSLTATAGGSTVLTQSSASAPIMATPLNASTNLNFFTTAATATPHTPNIVNSIYRITGFYFT